jgi:uncharacterized membrane protein
MRGKKNAMSEAYILMIIYNLKRCLSIMGEKTLEVRSKVIILIISLVSTLLLVMMFGQLSGLNNKDGKFAWRPLQLINPALYVYLVFKITYISVH